MYLIYHPQLVFEHTLKLKCTGKERGKKLHWQRTPFPFLSPPPPTIYKLSCVCPAWISVQSVYVDHQHPHCQQCHSYISTTPITSNHPQTHHNRIQSTFGISIKTAHWDFYSHPPLAAIQLPFHPAQPYNIGYLWSVKLIRAKITGELFVRYTRSTYSTPAGIRSNSFYAGHNGGRGGDSDYVRMRNQLEGWWWWFGMHPQQL